MEDRYNVECCDFICTHEDVVKKVQQEMPDEDTLYDLSELFRIFGDSTRIRILYVLFEAEMCVCDIAQLLGMTQSAISHQLRALKNARLVKARRDGKAPAGACCHTGVQVAEVHSCRSQVHTHQLLCCRGSCIGQPHG